MTHSFETEVAKDVGVNAAVILHNIYFWCAKNRANGENFRDGLYWTFNSVRALTMLFPYLSTQNIRTALNRLEEKGYIKTGKFSNQFFNRTNWYAATEKTNVIYEYRHIQNQSEQFVETNKLDLLKSTDGIVRNNKTIKDINTDINKDNVCDTHTKFTPPTVEDVAVYCKERKNGIDAKRFVDFYEAKGWMIGKNRMKDWKAAVRTWERDADNRYQAKEQELSFNPKEIEMRAILETPEL